MKKALIAMVFIIIALSLTAQASRFSSTIYKARSIFFPEDSSTTSTTSTTLSTTTTTLPADYDLSSFQEVSFKPQMSKAQTLTLDKLTNYKLTLKKIDSNKTYLIIESQEFRKQDVILAVSESKDLDLNEDSKNDIKITLNSIENNKASLTMKNLAFIPVKKTNKAEIEIITKTSYAWLWVLIAIIIIAAILLLAKSKSKGKHAYYFKPPKR